MRATRRDYRDCSTAFRLPARGRPRSAARPPGRGSNRLFIFFCYNLITGRCPYQALASSRSGRCHRRWITSAQGNGQVAPGRTYGGRSRYVRLPGAACLQGLLILRDVPLPGPCLWLAGQGERSLAGLNERSITPPDANRGPALPITSENPQRIVAARSSGTGKPHALHLRLTTFQA